VGAQECAVRLFEILSAFALAAGRLDDLAAAVRRRHDLEVVLGRERIRLVLGVFPRRVRVAGSQDDCDTERLAFNE
jgi:hypothetical protein